MRARNSIIGVSFLGLAAVIQPGCAQAEGSGAEPTTTLADTLRSLARSAKVDILFDEALLAARPARAAPQGRDVLASLQALLADTGLEVRRLSNGAYLVVRPVVPPPETAEIPIAVSEILVLGAKSHNLDIRRGPNDIQPYRIISQTAIADSQSQDVGDLLRLRLTANSVLRALDQAPVANLASNRSQVNLRGLGARQTLLLVDGRRMPSTPSYYQIGQPDVNGLPLVAIARVESLSSTAGGVYGPGATGGVVNLVLKRDVEGLTVDVGGGLTEHGDGRHWQASAVWGRAFMEERLRLFMAVSHAEDQGLRFGDRDYAQRARLARFANGSQTLMVGNAWNLRGVIPSLGSAPVLSFAPLAVPPGSAEGGSLLLANAGRIDLALPRDGQGTMQSLLTHTRTNALVLSARLGATSRVDLFADALLLRNRGDAVGPWMNTDEGFAFAPLGGAPFSGRAQLVFPTPGLADTTTSRVATGRVTLGAIARLGHGWTAEAEAMGGSAQIKSRLPVTEVFRDFLVAARPNPFLDADAMMAALAAFQKAPASLRTSISRTSSFSVRAGGPVAALPAGPATLTVLVETGRDRQPRAAFAEQPSYLNSDSGPYPQRSNALTLSTTSAYGEARLPLLGRGSRLWPLRGLELQLTARSDRYRYRVPLAPDRTEAFANQSDTAAFTLGARFWPASNLMLRGALATGYVPPAPADLLQTVTADYVNSGLRDPRRGGEIVAQGRGFVFKYGGSEDLGPERSRSLTLGGVYTPSPKMRLAVDYTRIHKTREVSHFASYSAGYVLASEALRPEKVKRAPLTEADQARGYAGGIIEAIDARSVNLGRAWFEAFDIDADYGRDLAGGTFKAFLQATLVTRFDRRSLPELAVSKLAGHLDGPLRWRGALGAQWSRGDWQFGLSGHAYAGYRVSYGDTTAASYDADYSVANVAYNGRERTPAQAYVDGDLAWRPQRGQRQVVYRLGVRNLLNQRPPAERIPIRPTPLGRGGQWVNVDPGVGYSTLGDPRGRRFELTVSTRF